MQSTKLWAVLIALAALLVPALALAQKPQTIHVVALDSDDASEDQADALTSSIRSRVRNSPSFQLSESNQSLSTLLPALKCPSRPDSACLQRIGDQLKTDRFIWGYVQKAPMPHQVTAEVHLWTRGKPEQVAKETYSDNLKDANDDALRRVASSLYEHLTGQATQGTIAVHVNGAQTGTVLVDGKAAGQLDHGAATLLVGSGGHSIEVQADGMSAPAQTINVAVNATTDVTFDLKALATATPVTPSGPSHIKRTIGFITVGVAGAALIAAGVMGGLYFGGSDASAFNDWRNAHGGEFNGSLACTNASPTVLSIPGQAAACSARERADTFGTTAWVLGSAAVGLAAVGVVLIMTDHGKEEGAPPPATSLRVLPTFGPNGAGLDAVLNF
ncbi:MAG TPA: hypothetical protein VGH28_05870 [Polyangiaceae bacterium]|jgi:hypothetical protein